MIGNGMGGGGEKEVGMENRNVGDGVNTGSGTGVEILYV